MVGTLVGASVVGSSVGVTVGLDVGFLDGFNVGVLVGFNVGHLVGFSVVGLFVGFDVVGLLVGFDEGMLVVGWDVVGPMVGLVVGKGVVGDWLGSKLREGDILGLELIDGNILGLELIDGLIDGSMLIDGDIVVGITLGLKDDVLVVGVEDGVTVGELVGTTEGTCEYALLGIEVGRWLVVEGKTVALATVVSLLDNSNTLTASTVALDVGLEVGDKVEEEASSSSTITEGFAVVDATSSVAGVLEERCCRLGASVVVGIDDGETLGLSEG